MSPDGHHNGTPAETDDILRRLTEAVSDLGPGGLQDVLHRVLAAVAVGVDPFPRRPPPSRRRPRRLDVVTYQVRIDLKGTKPPLWRRLELASDLFLDDVHDVVQAAFGWTDSHLHRFGCGPEYYNHDTEYYLCPFEVEEGETGVPEEQVRLDEVLVEIGDKLLYTYDFGDDWQHTIRLEAIACHGDSAPRVVCTAGRRPGPAEDCGGVYGYELIAAATDPTHADHSAAVADYARHFGFDAVSAPLRSATFDIGEINNALADLGLNDTASQIDLPEPLDELVHAIRTSNGKLRLRRLIGEAALDQPVQVDTDTAARMVHPYTWLLDRVGTDGIPLTGAGYLPPVHVEAALTELRLATDWIGKGNRESQTLPVLNLRESAQKAGLLRKYRGKLLLTAQGHAMRRDPVALWWLLAEKTPPRCTDACQTQAGLIVLVATAAQITDDLNTTVADLLGEIGWVSGDDTPLTDSMASHAAWNTTTVLRRVGAFTDERRVDQRKRSTPDGVAFARA
ncbi:MAG: plasmid pRiA4b ORF-3 family protein, partial [Pseudonocardiaceae bacterium]